MDSRRWRVAGTQVHESIDGEMVEQPKLKDSVAHGERAGRSPAGVCFFSSIWLHRSRLQEE